MQFYLLWVVNSKKAERATHRIPTKQKRQRQKKKGRNVVSTHVKSTTIEESCHYSFYFFFPQSLDCHLIILLPSQEKNGPVWNVMHDENKSCNAKLIKTFFFTMQNAIQCKMQYNAKHRWNLPWAKHRFCPQQ